MIVLGIPVVNQNELTDQVLKSLEETVVDKANFEVVIIDNNSDTPYVVPTLDLKVRVIRNNENQGYYYPLLTLYNLYKSMNDDVFIGLCHNDVIFYENGWDLRIVGNFNADSKLGLIGFCGSNEVDYLGGRGGGTMSNFKGFKGQLQEHTGRRVNGLEPALILDSLFMLFRARMIPYLQIDQKIVPCHFYDKIWSMRIVENKFHVAVLGILIDHVGGQTAVGVQRIETDFKAWCRKMNIPTPISGSTSVYIEAENRWLGEYREQKEMLPCKIDYNYNVQIFSSPQNVQA